MCVQYVAAFTFCAKIWFVLVYMRTVCLSVCNSQFSNACIPQGAMVVKDQEALDRQELDQEDSAQGE